MLSKKLTFGSGIIAFFFLLGLMAAINGCATAAGESPVLTEGVEPSRVYALSTLLPTAAIAEDRTTSIQAKVEPPTGKNTPLFIPTITPIPTAAATERPTDIPPSPQPSDTQPLMTPTATETATKSPPLPTPNGIYSWTLKVPILMYHYISIPPRDADKYRKDLSVSPQDFREQIAYLKDNGFETIDLYDLSLAIANKKELPAKPVVITLDDGYRDNYENAFPILKEYGFEATFFVVSKFIDDNLENYMTWDMVKEMSEAGMRIEPHSKTHADLSAHEKEYIVYEVLGSMETIAAHIGERPRFFCYPGGRYNETTLEVIEELDFWGAVTTASGEWHHFDDRYERPRLRVRNTTTLSEFIDLVDPGGTIAGKSVN
ncbi:MAG: polysaccharide deacetylase family protein [Candidatus Promineifilaceae bacterium]|nr:polysaccharide deacetylase family protein [Candidatus Promineifilaceae bacterium]